MRAYPPENSLSQRGGVSGSGEVGRKREGVKRCLDGRSAEEGKIRGVRVITVGVTKRLKLVFIVKIREESIDWFDGFIRSKQENNMAPGKERQIPILGGAIPGLSARD